MGEKVKRFQRIRDRNEAGLRLLILLVIAGILIIPMLISSLQRSAGEGDDIEFKAFWLDQIYPQAFDAATEWKSDAQLRSAHLSFLPASSSQGRWAALSFRSPGSPQEWLGVFISEPDGGLEIKTEAGIFERDGRPIGEPIDLDQLALGGEDALELSLANGGWDVIRKRGDSMFWPQDLFLQYEDTFNETGPILWRVDFGMPFASPDLRIFINANTGEIIEIKHQD